MTYLWRMPVTAIAVLLAVLYLSIEILEGVDTLTILSAILTVLQDLEFYHADDLLVVIGLLTGGLVLDALLANRRHKRALEIHKQRLRVFKATMRTVQGIVNNCLNNLQLFRLDTETVLPPTSLDLFDQLIRNAAEKLQVLGNLEDTPERPMATGVGIDYPQSAADQGHALGDGTDAP